MSDMPTVKRETKSAIHARATLSRISRLPPPPTIKLKISVAASITLFSFRRIKKK